MKKLWLFLASFLTIGSTSGCSLFEYLNKKVNIYRNNEEADKQISLRYYYKHFHIPYIEVNDYYEEFFKRTFDVKKDDNGYKYSLSDNVYIYFNVNENSISVDGLTSFSNHPDFVSTTQKTFLELEGITHTESKVKTIDLDDYDIHFYEDNERIYAPLTFLSKLCGGIYLYDIAYNGKDIYVLDYGCSLTPEERTTEYYGDKYLKKIGNLGLRSKDMVRYTYNELCFVFDNLRGETTKLLFGEDKLESLGLDKMLETYYPEIKELLLSTGKRKYDAGILSLFFGLDDGGHTAMLTYFPSLLVALYTKVTGSESLSQLLNAVNDRDNASWKIYQSCDLARSGEFGTPGGFYYYIDQEAETAYIGFDSFDVDYEAWDNYYKEGGDIPIHTDTYAFVRDKLYKAKSGGAKNVVLDITTNGGGDTNALSGLVGLFNNAKCNFTTKDTFNDFIATEHYKVDINLDGKIDELDEEELNNFNFNVGVLTSGYSFSCGNLFPAIMKNLGYPIIGQKSGGGSCAIAVESTADGIAYVRSSHLTLVDEDGVNIDDGIPVDYEIEMKDDYYVDFFDARDYFNPSLLKEVLANFYS